MTSHLRRLITASVIAIGLESSMGIGQSSPADMIQAPPVPPGIQAPEGNTAFLEGHAVGTQNYICLPSPSGFSWTFFAPQATLFVTLKWIPGDIRQQILTHFLSPNPSESDTPRATWQSSLDTSKVWGRSIASSTDPNFVSSGSIPWLLLEVVGTERGPAGRTGLTGTTFIQRLNTSGGVAPSTGCSQSTNVGSAALVPYTADYFFYKASR